MNSHGSGLTVTEKIGEHHEMVGRAISYSLVLALWWHGLTVDGKALTALSNPRETIPWTSQKRKYGQTDDFKKAENTFGHRSQAYPRTLISQSTSTMHRGPEGVP